MIRIGIIGSEGKIGSIRKQILKKKEDVEIVALCDISFEKGLINKSRKNIPHLYSNWKEMTDKEDLDAVFICTPHSLIPDIAIYSINKNINVFAEKPPGTKLNNIINIRDTYKNHPNLKIQFGFNHRWHDSVLRIYEILKKQKLGKLLWMRGVYGKSQLENWRKDKELAGHGILLGQGIHMLDIFNLFASSEWTEIKSLITNNYYQYHPDIEENVFAILRNEDNQMASIHSSALLWKHTFNIEFGFEKGYAKIEGFLTTSRSFGFVEKLIIGEKDDYYGRRGNPKETIYYFDIDKSWEREIDQFIKSIKYDKDIRWGNIDDAYNVMKLIDKIYQDGK